MGYTHYWCRPTTLPVRAFAQAAQDCRAVTEWLSREHGVRIQYDPDEPEPPCFDGTAVWFNGAGGEGHETFHVPRVYEPHPWEAARGGRFAFCKTARKPYDTAVCACLIVLAHHLSRKFRVTSDGDDEDAGWTLARTACQRALGYGGDFTLVEPVRFSTGGLPYKRVADLSTPGRNGRTVYRLADGRYLVRHHSTGSPGSGGDRAGLVVVATEPINHEVVDVGRAATVADARWLATCQFLAREFKDAPYLDEFLAPAREQPGEWLGLWMWADKLDEMGSECGPKLRAVLPGTPSRR